MDELGIMWSKGRSGGRYQCHNSVGSFHFFWPMGDADFCTKGSVSKPSDLTTIEDVRLNPAVVGSSIQRIP
jgi:hypothetical protein